MGFWRDRLAGIPDQVDLPSDRVRPAEASYAGATVEFEIDAGVCAGLSAVARASSATVFMVAHAGLSVLLSRLSGAVDVVIGTPVAGRGERALDDLVGMFVNTLVLRLQVDPLVSFQELVEQARAQDLAALAHSEVPFERLVEVLNPPRSMARHPLFQVMLAFENADQAEFELDGLSVRSAAVDVAVAKFDLDFTLVEVRDPEGQLVGLKGVLSYATDLFDEVTAESFAARYVSILGQVAADAS
ncbi:condensation domain-containing protein, partial [Dietzia cercidiphylli]|uniref:condensation domain-containing protein n=1 Tax=Dietzia cercidiphylli TaxID=498199 RepID=UPI003F7DB676